MRHAPRPRAGTGVLVAGAAVALSSFALVAGGDDDDASPDTGTETDGGADAGDAGGAALEVTSFAYTDVSAPAGGTLEVVNTSGGAHTFTAEGGEFDEDLPDGEAITVQVPDEPGDYAFFCGIHPSMTGTLTAE
jgi:plastocyanin